MRGFQGIWAPNASWPELQWRGPLLPVFRWKLWTFENQIHESYQSQGNTKPFNLPTCSLKLENNWEKDWIGKEFFTFNFSRIPKIFNKKIGSLWIFESTNDQSVHYYVLIKKKSPTSTRTLLSSALMSALSLSTFSFLGREISPKLVGNGWTVIIHPPPWLTSNVQHKGPAQNICDPHQAIKFGWKNIANIVSCVNLLLRLVSKVAEACQLQAVKQLHRTGMSRIPNK